MSSRGRGYSRGSRGSYRGSSSSYRGSSSRPSSSYNSSSSRGGSSRYNNGYPTSYDSRSTSSRYPPSSSDRYSSSTRGSDSYKRSSDYRGGGSTRDRTPERKRSRHEQGSRRSHDYGSGTGDYHNSRTYESSSTYDKRDSRNSRSRSSPQPSSLSRSSFRSRDGSSGRRSKERMGPPKSLPMRSSRGSTYRGRLNTRGLRPSRGITRRTDLRDLTRKRFPTSFSSSKSQYIAKILKIARMRSSIKKKRSLERSASPERKEKKRTTDESKEEKHAKDDEKKKSSKKVTDSTEEGDATKKVNDGETDKDQETTPVKKKLKLKSVVKKEKTKEDGTVGTDKEDEGVNAEEEDDDLEDISDKEEMDEEKIDEEDKKSKKDIDVLPKSRYTGKSFIKLTCVHCGAKCLTFKEYSNHLHTRVHRLAMTNLSGKQKSMLSRMRQDQRASQRTLEKGNENERSQFCLLCRLNYRQPKVKHQLSEHHRVIKKFLLPYCRICRISFKSPMVFEAHRCSLEHIKKKARNLRSNADSSGDEIKAINLENFMTVDSVGDVDGNDNEEIDETGEDLGNANKDEVINVGSEHVKKVEAHYCELCCMHLPQMEDLDTALRRHCATRSHLRAYLQHREDKNLRKAAEKIHRRHQESKEAKEKTKDTTKEGDSKEGGNPDDTEDVGDDKIWADVDKDLGDLLREVGPENGNADEDDEEDSRLNAERYDRFKNSEKLNNAAKLDVEENDEEKDVSLTKGDAESSVDVGIQKDVKVEAPEKDA